MAILDTVIGGVLAIAGSVAVQIYQLRYTRKTKMDEAIAARKVTANAEAYRNIKRLEGAHIQLSPEDASRMANEQEAWLFDNLLFLPGDYAEHWLTIRTHLGMLTRPQEPDKAMKIDDTIRRSLSAAIGEVYKDAGLERPEWDSRMYTDLVQSK